MIGIDTNVLVRILETDDNRAQTSAANKLLRNHGSVFVSPIVLAELVWVLESQFGLDSGQIFERLQRLLGATEFQFFAREAMERAVAQFGNGKPDFADCLIGELNLAMGCETTMTFDKDAARTGPFTRLQS